MVLASLRLGGVVGCLQAATSTGLEVKYLFEYLKVWVEEVDGG
jgi:hypothetical protein